MVKITNKDINTAFNAITNQLKKPDYIIAVPRGGLWLAQYLAYYFDLDKSKLKMALDFDAIKDLSGNIVVCDDIYDTGKQALKFPENLTFCTLFARCRHQQFPSNLVYGKLIETDEYLWFPWDFGN